MPKAKLKKTTELEIIGLIAEATVMQRPIKYDDEIYYDMKIYGDPLFDLLSTIASRFGTDFSELHLPEYAPGEGFSLFSSLAVALGRRPFRSLRVSDLIAAVELGRWGSR
jgi:hypothetical protein